MDRLLQDIRVGIRGLLHSPGFALTAISTLALGIGIATAVFTVADALLLRRLPVKDQDRLVTLWGEQPDRGFDNYPFALSQVQQFPQGTRALEQVAFFDYHGAIPQLVRDGDQVSRLHRSLVSGAFFDVLGSAPLLGRVFHSADDVTGAAPVLVLSYAAWQQRFGGDPGVLGQRVVMHGNDLTYTVVGVMPQGLDYPRGTDFWAPVVPSTRPADVPLISLDILARLASGATPAEARDETTAFFRSAETSPWNRGVRGVVHPLPSVILGETKPAVLVFTVAALLLLLISCVNVASLLLVRGLARVREIAVRSALGAARRQITRQLLTENLLLAIAGGAAGIAVAAAGIRLFIAVAPADIPRLDQIQLNGAALAGAVGITGLAVLIFALAPAILASRGELNQVLRSATRQSGGARGSRLAGEGLVATQLALALLVLSAAGLIGRSLIKLETADLSLDPSNLLIAQLALRVDQYDKTAKQLALLDILVPRLEAIPGVRAVSPIVSVPFVTGWSARPGSEGQTPAEAAANPWLNMEVVGPGYFTALGLRVVQGRAFTDADREGAPAVTMVSEATARHYWPGVNPIGQRLFMGGNLEMALTVVGVVPDARYHDLPEVRPSFYFPLRQSSFFPAAPTTLAIRTDEPSVDLVPAMRRVIREIDPGIALASAAPFDSYLDAPLAQPRLNAILLAVFALAAVALAAVGLFGTMATMVRQRTRELGVRMALGATARDLRGMVMRRALGIALTGAIFGLAGSLAANRLLVRMLYQVEPTDGTTLAGTTALLLAVAALAGFIPARASTRVDPAVALRSEA